MFLGRFFKSQQKLIRRSHEESWSNFISDLLREGPQGSMIFALWNGHCVLELALSFKPWERGSVPLFAFANASLKIPWRSAGLLLSALSDCLEMRMGIWEWKRLENLKLHYNTAPGVGQRLRFDLARCVMGRWENGNSMAAVRKCAEKSLKLITVICAIVQPFHHFSLLGKNFSLLFICAASVFISVLWCSFHL